MNPITIFIQVPKSVLSLLGCLIFIACTTNVFGQNEEPFLQIKKGVAFNHAGEMVRFKSLEETNTNFIFKGKNKKSLTIDKNQIAQIEQQTGNRAGVYALSGIVVTVATVATIVWIDYKMDDDPMKNSPNTFEQPTISILAIFGASIGALIGLTQKKYKTVYQSPSLGNTSPKLELKTTSQNQIPSLTISYNF